MITIPHPLTTKLRAAREGIVYYPTLTVILAEMGPTIRAEFKALRKQHGKVTPVMLGALASRHNLPMKALCEYYETQGMIPTGMYEYIQERGPGMTKLVEDGKAWLAEHPIEGVDQQ